MQRARAAPQGARRPPRGLRGRKGLAWPRSALEQLV